MKSIDEIERMLEQTPAPRLDEGPHRELLRERLAMEGRAKLYAPQGRFLFARMSPALRFAAGMLAVVALVGAGWAAEKIYEALTFKEVSVILRQSQDEKWKLPTGEEMTSTTAEDIVVPNDPKAVETALRHQDEMKELIQQKKYKLLRTIKNSENNGTGEDSYTYSFTYSDGTQEEKYLSMPLDEVSSWEDYEQKQQEQMRRYHEKVNRAIATGRYRLINQDLILIHVCRDTESQEKFKVQRIPVAKGEAVALYRPYDITTDQKATSRPQSTWEEHLRAVSEGKLELLDVETVPMFAYELIFEDGKKGIFHYAGSGPLGEAKAK